MGLVPYWHEPVSFGFFPAFLYHGCWEFETGVWCQFLGRPWVVWVVLWSGVVQQGLLSGALMALNVGMDEVLGDNAMTKAGNGVPTLSSPGEGLSRISAFKVQKVNGCLVRAQMRLVVVIQMEVVAEDLEYYNKHVLIYKFMGMRVFLRFLDPWIWQTWNLKGDFLRFC